MRCWMSPASPSQGAACPATTSCRMSSTSIIAASGRESARTRAVVLLPAAGGPVSRRGRTVSLWHHPCSPPTRAPQWRHVLPAGAARPPAPGGGGRARPLSPADGPAHLREPWREHHVPTRQRRRAAPRPGAPTAAARPRGRLRRGHPVRDRLAPGHPSRDRAGRAARRCRRTTGPPPSRCPRPERPGSARCCAGWTDASTSRPLARCTSAGWARPWPGCTTRPMRGRPGRLRPHPLGPRDVLRGRHGLREHPGRRVLGPAAAGGPGPLPGGRRPTGRR